MVQGATHYFRNKWKACFHCDVTVEEINELIKNAMLIQYFVLYFDKKAQKAEKILATYWLPKKNLILKIDTETKSAVTFYTDIESDKNQEGK